MLYDPARHEQLTSIAWDESVVSKAIELIIRDSQQRFSDECYWPWHPKDLEPGDDQSQPALPLYHGATGVIWALRYLQNTNIVSASQPYEEHLPGLLERNRAWLKAMPAD